MGGSMLNRHCPYCFKHTFTEEFKNIDVCRNCKKTFKIKHGLTKITLVKLSANNYTFPEECFQQVTEFLKNKHAYIAEISRNVGLTEGQIRTILRDLLAENKIEIESIGRKKYVSLK